MILTLLVVLAVGPAFAQSDVDSPYSMFGLGQVRNKTMNARLKGMGGVANAMFGKSMVNAANPASYAMIDTLAFLFDAGIYAKSSTFSTSSASEKASCASLDYVAMGFAPTKWWKVALGAQPYSNVGYNVVTSFQDDIVGSYQQTFEGEGGLNQVFLGNAFRLGKHFAIGANANYVFGDSKSTTTLTYPDSTFIICSRRGRDVMISSFMFDYGLMFQGQLGNDLTLGLGLTYNQKINLRGTQTLFIRSIEAGVYETSVEYLIDTITYKTDKNARYTMPHGVGFGVSLQKANRWTLGADFNWADWSSFARNGNSELLQDSWSIAVGGEFIPSSNTLSNYWTRVSYRLGGFFEQTYLTINGTSINKLGVTAGLTLPLPRTQSRVNLGLELGKCGTKSASLIQESYVNLTVGVSIFERWFVKRRYN
ncbi:MAG: outer membrane protein transport protein [Bacteroidales bacterium]|nr:outer membrane protein transport protein [Bacteroidales bacterium]